MEAQEKEKRASKKVTLNEQKMKPEINFQDATRQTRIRRLIERKNDKRFALRHLIVVSVSFIAVLLVILFADLIDLHPHAGLLIVVSVSMFLLIRKIYEKKRS